MSQTKERLDVLLVSNGIFPSREKARASIMAGQIFIDGQRVDKAGEKVPLTSEIEVRGDVLPYVSRGGLKLEKALESFKIDLNELTCFDIGASTGGFTDCMLQNGAKKVIAIDVGYGQFAWKLRTDTRVVCLERTNVRYVTPQQIGDIGDFASIDVSFISLKKVVIPVINLLSNEAKVVALIKPQFEAGRDKVGKKGVVKDPLTHKEVISGILNFLIEQKLNILNLDFSPIRGPEGNIEYLVYFTKNYNVEVSYDLNNIDKIVERAHGELK
jgi:23S rRNA (cytidine1920-2'-O)/16S rRNA (cytidine1409-2'-O)-methyltransferase